MAHGLKLERFTSYLMSVLDTAYRLAYYVSGSHSDAERVLEAAILEAVARFPTFEPDSASNVWFLKIVMNQLPAAASHGREEGPAARTPDAPDPAWFHSLDGSFHATLQGLRQEQIADGFASLPMAERTVCALALVEGLPCQEIAEIVGATVNATRARLSHGRRALTRSLLSRTSATRKRRASRASARQPAGSIA